MIKTQQLPLQREPMKTRSTQSEHSQGRAQRSEQYLLRRTASDRISLAEAMDAPSARYCGNLRVLETKTKDQPVRVPPRGP